MNGQRVFIKSHADYLVVSEDRPDPIAVSIVCF